MLALVISGCASLSSNSPTSGQVRKTAKCPESAPIPYSLVRIDADVVTYFIAQLFPTRDKDIILFANSSIRAVQKALGLISNLFNPLVAVRTATQ